MTVPLLTGNEMLPNSIVGLDGNGNLAATTVQHSTAALPGAGSTISTAAATAFSSTTLATVTGLTQVLRAGTYKFSVRLPGTADATGGVKYALTYSSASITSLQSTGKAFTASAVAVQNTTTTASQTSLLASTAAVIYSEIDGELTTSTPVNVALQFAQNVSTASTSTTLVGALMQFIKIG